MDLKQYIIEKSKNIGIDIIRFTKSKELNKKTSFLEERKKKGYDTEFEEADISLRTDPNLLMKESRTIIGIGVSYNVENSTLPQNTKLHGLLSRSSWGEDYHIVLRKKMEMLVNEISKIKDLKYIIYVDTSPLIDREIASEAGIGWYGKNCSIINDEFGSFIFLGYILTDLELEEDSKLEGKCGECKLCINACPTKAIEEGYIINTKRCVSYLTQTKERIPYDLREKIGTRVYGCDTCQQACPKNKEIIKSSNIEFLPKSTNGIIDIEEILTITNKEFREKYGNMSGSWRGKNILKRNCIIALGNIGDKNSVELLRSALKDESSMVREYAAWALIKIDKEEGTELVNKQLLKEKDIGTANEMKKTIKYFNGNGI